MTSIILTFMLLGSQAIGSGFQQDTARIMEISRVCYRAEFLEKNQFLGLFNGYSTHLLPKGKSHLEPVLSDNLDTEVYRVGFSAEYEKNFYMPTCGQYKLIKTEFKTEYNVASSIQLGPQGLSLFTKFWHYEQADCHDKEVNQVVNLYVEGLPYLMFDNETQCEIDHLGFPVNCKKVITNRRIVKSDPDAPDFANIVNSDTGLNTVYKVSRPSLTTCLEQATVPGELY